jgi:serine protease Do
MIRNGQRMNSIGIPRNVGILILAAVMSGVFFPIVSNAQTGDPENTRVAAATWHSPFVTVADEVRPAVVNISAESITKRKVMSPEEEFFRQFFGLAPGQMPEQTITQRVESLGSGFVFRAEGYIMTNNHVISGAQKITVIMPDKQQYKADVVGFDQETDIAVLKIRTSDPLQTIPLGDSDSLLVGDWVMAVGNPYPNLGLNRTVTLGVVSAKGRTGLAFGDHTPSYQDYIQTDASINPGNSGGPLVNIQGKVMGVNSAIVSPTGGNIGIGFAVPINLAKDISDQLIKTGKVSRGYLGVLTQDITPEIQQANNLPSTEGVLVAQVDANTPAMQAGIKVGDVITTFDGKNVINSQHFRFLVAGTKPGTESTFGIWRDGKSITLKVKLGDRAKFLEQATKEQPKPEAGKESKAWGLTVDTFTKSMADQLGVSFVPGVIITDIAAGSAGDNSGLSAGDIILKIDGQNVTTADEYNALAKKLEKSSKPVSFYIRRGQVNMFIAVGPQG